MSFETRLHAFAARFLSPRTYELIVLPALADLQFECDAGPTRRAANQFAVLKAVAGGLGDDLTRAAGDMLALTLLPASYYIFFMLICFDVYKVSISTGFVLASSAILVLSVAPVLACFWPDRPAAPPVD
jgi:hypothetical protein